MFEALFILTVLDAGTRVAASCARTGRPRVETFARTGWMSSILDPVRLSSACGDIFCIRRGRSTGGINSLWPLLEFQSVAGSGRVGGSHNYFVENGPYTLDLGDATSYGVAGHITMTALSEIFDANPRIGFLAFAKALTRKSRREKFPPPSLWKPSAHLQPRLDAAVTAVSR